MSYCIELAGPEDDAPLCALFRDVGMADDGPYRLGYARDPCFFDGLGVEGTFTQACVCRVGGQRRIEACFTRTTRPAWINGEVRELGYLGGLRIRPRHRRGTLLARGYRRLKQLHRDGRCPYYLTTILEGNRQAIDLLTSGRAGLPRYHDIGRYVCSVFLTRRRRTAARAQVERGSPDNLEEILRCLQRNGARHQFAPAWRRQDFDPGQRLTRGFSMGDFYALRRGGEVAAVLGAWDQRVFKRTTVEAYSTPMRASRLLWNRLAPMLGFRGLPAPGEEIPLFFGAFLAVDDDDPELFSELLGAVTASRAEAGYLCCILGLHEADPLLQVAARARHLDYRSRLYLVCWEDGEAARAEIDGRIPFLEAAVL